MNLTAEIDRLKECNRVNVDDLDTERRITEQLRHEIADLERTIGSLKAQLKAKDDAMRDVLADVVAIFERYLDN